MAVIPYLLNWRSILEILFFSSVFYYFSLWLRRDRTKNLLAAFYGYCLLSFIAYAVGITTITHFLFLFAPVTIMLFVVLHQETLQRNFILMKNITPVKASEEEWLEILMSSLLTAVSHQKQVMCVIEKQDSLSTMLASPLRIHTTIQKDLMDILLASASYDEQKLIWVNQQGMLLGINATWHALVDEVWVTDEVQQLEVWKQDALLLTNKTDALVFKISPATRTFDIIAQKKLIEHCTATEAMTVIKRYLQGKDHLAQLPTDVSARMSRHTSRTEPENRNQ